MSTLKIDLPPKLIPVFAGKADARRFTVAVVWEDAKLRQDDCGARPDSPAGRRKGIVLCGRQWQNSLEDLSLSEVKLAIESEHGFCRFDIGEKYVKTRDGRILVFVLRVGAQRRQHQVEGENPAVLVGERPSQSQRIPGLSCCPPRARKVQSCGSHGQSERNRRRTSASVNERDPTV